MNEDTVVLETLHTGWASLFELIQFWNFWILVSFPCSFLRHHHIVVIIIIIFIAATTAAGWMEIYRNSMAWSHLNLTIILWDRSIIPIPQTRKLKPREGEWLVQGHKDLRLEVLLLAFLKLIDLTCTQHPLCARHLKWAAWLLSPYRWVGRTDMQVNNYNST